MGNFTELIPNLTFVVAIFTLSLTFVGLVLARSAKLQLKSTEPWSLTELEGGLWLLKRNAPVLATIHGIIIDNNENIAHATDFQDLNRIERNSVSLMSATPDAAKVFQNGTTLMIKIRTGKEKAVFTLYYEEHKKEPSTSNTDSHQEVKSSKVQSWKTIL